MFNYFLVYNDVKNTDIAVRIEERPEKPAPEMQLEEVFIPGASRTLYREKGYAPIEITVSMNFISRKPSEWDNHWRKIKKWLLSKGNQKLQFCDDLEVFYKVDYTRIESVERTIRKAGAFQVTFVCDPFVYIVSEEEKITNQLYNDFLLSKPIYKITGNGTLNMTINNKQISVNVGQELIVDTDRGLCYKSDNSLHNVSLTGTYEDMYLQPGENTFTFDPPTGFSVFVQPNWRCL